MALRSCKCEVGYSGLRNQREKGMRLVEGLWLKDGSEHLDGSSHYESNRRSYGFNEQ